MQTTFKDDSPDDHVQEHDPSLFVLYGRPISPSSTLYLLFLLTFIVYSCVDFLNLSLHMYPLYTANLPYNNQLLPVGLGVADLQLFYKLGNAVLHGSYTLFLSYGQWDGGPLAPFFYAIPVFVSQTFNLDAGYSFREFYLLFLLACGVLLYKIAETFLSAKLSCYIAVSYVYNPFVFIGSVWAGNEEIIATLLLLIVIYFLQTHHYVFSLLSVFVASGYKFYALLFLPLIVFCMPTLRTRVLTTFVLGILALAAAIGIESLYPGYVAHIFAFFIQTFPDRGDGLIPFFVSWGWINTSPTGTFIYFSLMFLVLLLFAIYLGRFNDIERFGIFLLAFFLLYPQFFLNYLLIPFALLQFYFFKNRLLWYSYMLFTIPAILSQFAFTHAITIYNMFNLTPDPLLLTIGFLNLVITYVLMLAWIGLYLRNTKSTTHNNNESTSLDG